MIWPDIFHPRSNFSHPAHAIAFLPRIAGKVVKGPKCKIFGRSDFNDFYTIKPFWAGDWGKNINLILKKKKKFFGGGGVRHHLISRAYAYQFLAHMLSVRIKVGACA
jgi:hypothetical protein